MPAERKDVPPHILDLMLKFEKRDVKLDDSLIGRPPPGYGPRDAVGYTMPLTIWSEE
jgi:hypothetical protein